KVMLPQKKGADSAMAMITDSVLEGLQQEELVPGTMTQCLGYFPEIFEYLKQRQQDMGKARPIVTYATAATVWAFQSCGEPQRELPSGILQHIWSKLVQGSGGDHLSSFLEQCEPGMWDYFVKLTQAAARKEDWDQSLIAAAALAYAPVLTACIYIFWPVEELEKLEGDIFR
ncbi:MAG: hypothetical protein ACLFMR_06840, partial [Desulfohalobiaceae bacterium]